MTNNDSFRQEPVKNGQTESPSVNITLAVTCRDDHGSDKDMRGRRVTIAAALSAVGVD